ncbi:MAG: hypothetical protein AAB767_00800 [Patescibacteria group bacterium]
MENHSVLHHVSSSHCSRCHGEGEGFKCPKCAATATHYDPDHFRNCGEKGKMRVKCKKCGQSEDNCTCV